MSDVPLTPYESIPICFLLPVDDPNREAAIRSYVVEILMQVEASWRDGPAGFMETADWLYHWLVTGATPPTLKRKRLHVLERDGSAL